MRARCPTCKKSQFSRKSLRSVFPDRSEAIRPASITCPACGSASRITSKSRIGGVILTAIFAGAPYFIIHWIGVDLNPWQMGLSSIVGGFFFIIVIWPSVVQLEPWSEWSNLLPRSRLVGYSLYLLLPVAVIILCFYLAVRIDR